jgi:archaellum component FlaC
MTESLFGKVDHHQHHLVDRLGECVNLMGEASDKLGRFIDKLNNHIDTQEVQIEQLANMVNDLVGMTEAQKKEIKSLKSRQEDHRKVINTLIVKVITLEQCVEDVQKKVFPQVRRSATWHHSSC